MKSTKGSQSQTKNKALKPQLQPTSNQAKKESSESESNSNLEHDVKTSQHALRFIVVGIVITVFNYVLFAILSNLIITDTSLLWLSNLIATTATIIVAYAAHSKITWKERSVTKAAIVRFFIWNILIAILVSPALTQFFSIFTPLYEFAFHICEAIHLPFTYEFVLTTGAFILTSLAIMVINFFFYDRFVFQKKSYSKRHDETNS